MTIIRNFEQLILALACLFLLAPETFADKQVKVGVYQNNPKVFMNEHGRPAGFFITLLEEVAVREGWHLEYQSCQWNECLSMLEKGEIHLMPDVAYSQHRSTLFAFGKEVVLSSWSVFYTAAGGELHSLKGLNGKKVAVLSGSIQYQVLRQRAQELGVQPHYVELESLNAVFEHIQSGQVESGLVNTYFGRRFADDYQVRKSQVHIETSLLTFAATHSQATDLLPTIDHYIRTWKKQVDSIYYQAAKKWLDPLNGEFSKGWLYGVIAAVLAVALILFLLMLTFRTMVKAKTKELAEKSAHFDHLAHHDPLSGLPNRLLFFDRLEQSIRHSRRRGETLAVLFLDLDQFKQINDSFGHAVGDEVLKTVAQQLRDTVREEDTIARIGGDEFSIIMERLHTPADAVVGVQHLADAFNRPFHIPGHQFNITTSIGISLYPQDGEDAQTLLRNADTAMFKAKKEGRHSFKFCRGKPYWLRSAGALASCDAGHGTRGTICTAGGGNRIDHIAGGAGITYCLQAIFSMA